MGKEASRIAVKSVLNEAVVCYGHSLVDFWRLVGIEFHFGF